MASFYNRTKIELAEEDVDLILLDKNINAIEKELAGLSDDFKQINNSETIEWHNGWQYFV